ncbi:DUF6531 domain-containing protein [Arthrobacter sp. SX1312]|uniref:DUF6531 domain-containing protein n=1 Tax=Arthrobacter sp. SX1312 TaxID=2058896 RepID=UPI0011B002C2|nr:DUF6531 domain-containing protein [Arthrobacter sp. SX1312]
MTEFVEMPLLPESDASNGGRFSYGVAGSVRRAFESAATRLENQSGTRTSYVTAAKEDFKGHFSEVFQTNGSTAASDASALASALRTVAGYVGQMIDAAHEEDARRRENNEWVREHNDRNALEKGWDWLVGEEERPNADPGKAPSFAPASASTGSRETPGPGSGSGGGGGGTSSARPEHLRTFATNSRGLDDGLASAPGSLEGHLSDFASSCSWGSLEASGVLAAYRAFLTANENDAAWAVTIADAFAAAGGEGNVSTVSDAALNEALAAAGVSASRSALTIDPPAAAGAMPTSGYANDPVNTATGNFIEPKTDLGFTGAASSLVLSRMYNSLASGLETAGVFGPGWASVLDQHLSLSDEGARWVMADGRAVDFPRTGDAWGRAVGENYWLTREPATAAHLGELDSVPEGSSEVLVVRDNRGAWWVFSVSGVWLGAGSGPGRTVSVHREAPVDAADSDAGFSDASTPADGASDGAGLISRLAHVRGRFLDVEYVDGRAAVVRASDGRRVEYGYDDAGRLVTVSTETGTRTYRWNEAGLIDAVVSAAGVVEAENSYDEQGRVVLQVTQHGRRVRFAYLPGRVTVVSDEDGSRSNSWVADAKGRLVGVLDSEDRRQSMAYDVHGNLVSLTERDGSVTVHGYDDRGRRTRTVTPEGADLTYGWDEHDRLITLVTATGSVVTYEYADEGAGITRDPCVVDDALGGRTELHWKDGQLRRVTDPVGVSVGFEYDGFGDLIATRNAVGDVARIVRDQAGRPVAVISPSGAQTRFVYDSKGLLVRQVDPDGAVWAFEHDPPGRLTASIAPDGGRTSLEYGPTGDLVRTTDPLGRTISRVVDELGNVTGAVLSDGARWGFTHDTLSRLVGITDPAGHDWVREYDRVGALTAVVDPTGVRTDTTTDRTAGTATLADAFATTTYSFDQYGRPTKVQGADGTTELTTYDAAGNPVELLDGEGGLTVLGRDVAGKITSITSPTGAITRYEYDVCGRPWRTTDPTGAVTELTYDADQRVASRTLPTGEVETFTYDPCGRLVLHRTPGSGTAQYGYDACGRLTYSQDTWYGTRRFAYNTAGELVSTTNGVGGKTRFEYDTRGRLIRITDPLGGVTTRTYTQTDQVDSVTDPLGRVTTATYDPAGRQLSQTDPDGHTTTWTYDAAGQEATTSVDGRLVASIERDVMNRRVVITDHTGNTGAGASGDGLVVEHELGFDRRGLLTSRTRGGAGLSWSYDADGNRTSFTDATGTTTTYTRDPAGRVSTVTNPHLGDAVFTHDATGRLTQVTAEDLIQAWTYRDGSLTEHTRTHSTDAAGGTDLTLIGWDEDGRITALTRAGMTTRYGYDTAGQLISAATTTQIGGPEGPASQSEWEYDAGGRLVREVTATGSRVFEYDAAGELQAVTGPEGSRTEFVHDGLGRRTRQIGADGSWTEYAWGPTGHLNSTCERTPDGEVTSRHELWVDALGELAGIDGTQLWWDTANPIPTLTGITSGAAGGGGQVLSLPGGVTGIGDAWIASGWRAARPTDQTDPWAVLGTPTIPTPTRGGMPTGISTGMAGGLPAGVGLTGHGGVDIAGLEWLGARAYDPITRGFLSTDPLAPVLGAGWDGNPYAYAGNNPLNATDPTGLRPLTDDQLKAYDGTAGGAMAAAGDWLGDNWEYVVGGAAIVGGAVLMFVPGGQVAGMGLISFGADVVIQKATTGQVNWAQSAAMGAVGLLGGGALTAGRAAAATASSVSRLGSYVAVNAGVNGAAGAVGGAATHLIKNGGRVDNWRSFAGSVAGGTLSGAVGGLAGPAGGTLARAGGHGAYTLTAAGARPTLQAAAATTALGSGGAIAGTVTDKFISGEAVTWADVGWSGVTGGALTHLPGGPSSSSTLQQAARTNVSTLSGLASGGPNSMALVRSSLYGTTTGSGLDVAKFFVAGN